MSAPRLFIAGAAVGLVIGLIAAGLVGLQGAPGAPQGSGDGEGGGRAGSGGGGLPAVSTAEVGAANVGRTIEAIGTGRAAKSVTLVSEATGLVEAVAIKSGDTVKKGDLILKIEDAEQKIAVTRARAEFPIAKSNSERYAALYEENSASRLEAEAAFNAFKAAEADLRAAEFAFGQRTIRAPFDGVVGLTAIEPGDYVRAGDVVTTIDDLSALIIEFAAPQEAARHIEIGQSVEAALAGAAGETIAGAVSAIDSRVDSVSRTLKIEATVTGAGPLILPGATYAVRTTNEGAAAIGLPGLAVQWDRTGAYVWKLEEDGAAVRAAVTILQRRDDVAVVDGELREGDIVIVEGADRVRPGMKFPRRAAAAQGRLGAGGAGAP
jgi:RND family efflux transporter MFP subunit